MPAKSPHAIAATNSERIGHPTQKPLAVMRFTLDYAGMPDVVLDPFMGSGTTGVATLLAGKQFIGVEINPTISRSPWSASRMHSGRSGYSHDHSCVIPERLQPSPTNACGPQPPP